MKLFSTKQAARYLGISVATMKYHIHVGKNIKPQIVGHGAVFTLEQLDEFKRNRRKPGQRKGGKK